MFQFQSPDQIIDVRIDQLQVDGRCYPPRPPQDKPSQRLSHASDTSVPLFTLYLRISEEHDRRKYELIKGGLDSIIVFCGLFSATVAALIVPSIDKQANLKHSGGKSGQPSPASGWVSSTSPNPGGIPNQYHGTIPIGFAGGLIGILNAINMLWCYSLIFSIYCALHALVLQRSVKPRTWVTSPHYSLPEQARMSAYFTRKIERADNTVKKFQFMIVLSLFVFFVGLCTYLLTINLITAIISVFLMASYPLYLIPKQLLPYLRQKIKNLRRGSPHYSPITQARRTQFDDDVLKRTLDMSRSDDDLEQFFEAIPGFCASKIVDNPRRSLDVLGLQTLAEALIGFWNRTLSSNRVSESVKVRRLVVCVKLIEAADLSIAVPQILHLLFGNPDGVLRSVEIGHLFRTFRNGSVALLSRGIIAGVISNAERNDRWFTLAMNELCISEGVLREYLAHGDSALFANLIHITRHFFHSLLQQDSDLTRKSSSILSSLSEFDILDTLPELQQDFCDLWNEVVQQARSSKADDNPFVDILVEIRRLYVDLHGTDVALGYFFTAPTDHSELFHQPTSYPLCMTPDHHPKSATLTQETNGSTTGGTSQTITTASPILYESSLHHTATGMDITQGIAATSIPMSGPVTQYPSSTSGGQLPDGGITRKEFSSSTPMSPSNPPVHTISAPDITSGTAIFSGNGQDLDRTILTELPHLPN